MTVEVIEAVLSRQIDDLEPKLMRHGYDVRILANQFNPKPAEIRQFLQLPQKSMSNRREPSRHEAAFLELRKAWSAPSTSLRTAPTQVATFASSRQNAGDRHTYPGAICAMNHEDRKDPETLIGRVPESEKGRLKVYLGGAAGVGKTYRMLEEAQQLREQGHDVVLGFVETHGRAETAARIGDLEAVPLRKIPYRSVILEEMDVDAVLARQPEFAIVDELAHTNASGSRHNKRYQDVEELVGNGINVIAAFNVQHLASLNQMVRRITGVEIRETVPDTFLNGADQIVSVDISVAELRQRLREGKIYPPEQVEQALKNFFKPSNLAALRELALREVASDQSWKREELELLKREGGRRLGVTERLMVCLSSNREGGEEMLRQTGRIAAQLNADW